MTHSPRKAAGTLLVVGAAQFVIVGLIVAEASYPGYSASTNFISDLGVGRTALIFNTSIILLGLLIVASAYLLQLAFRKYRISAVFAVTGVGAVGVGVFPETVPGIHGLAALVVFVFGGLSAIASSRLQGAPFNLLSVALGLASWAALALWLTGNYLGLGVGGMERMVAYPVLLWAIGFGGLLMGS